MKVERVGAAVAALGGRVGSIPAWSFGAEHRAMFDRTLTTEELEFLAELNVLRGRAGVRLVEWASTSRQRQRINKQLASCHLFFDDGR